MGKSTESRADEIPTYSRQEAEAEVLRKAREDKLKKFLLKTLDPSVYDSFQAVEAVIAGGFTYSESNKDGSLVSTIRSADGATELHAVKSAQSLDSQTFDNDTQKISGEVVKAEAAELEYRRLYPGAYGIYELMKTPKPPTSRLFRRR